MYSNRARTLPFLVRGFFVTSQPAKSLFGFLWWLCFSLPVVQAKTPSAPQLWKKMQKALGGAAVWKKVNTLELLGTAELPTPSGWQTAQMRLSMRRPWHQRSELQWKQRRLVQLLSPHQGWLWQAGRWFPLPQALWKAALAERLRQEWLWSDKTPRLRLQKLRSRRLGKVLVWCLKVRDHRRRSMRLWLDKITFLPLQRQYRAVSMTGMGRSTYLTRFLHYQSVKKGSLRLQWPRQIHNLVDGQVVSRLKIQQVKLNRRMPLSLFRPSTPAD